MVKEYLKTLGAFAFAGVVHFGQPAVAYLMNPKFEDIGEGYRVKEWGNSRVFFIGTDMGLGRFCIDENKDGTLDEVLVNMPISPMMG